MILVVEIDCLFRTTHGFGNMATFLDVPTEVKEKILCHLPAVDLSSMEKCSSSLRTLVVGEDLWRKRAQLLTSWSKEKILKKIQELEEGNQPRFCENPAHHITVARARYVRIEGDCSCPVIQEMWQRPPVQVLRFYTHRGCGGAICTECLGRHLGNCFDYCLVCGGGLVSPWSEYEESDEEDYQQECSKGEGLEEGGYKGNKDEHTDKSKIIEEKSDLKLESKAAEEIVTIEKSYVDSNKEKDDGNVGLENKDVKVGEDKGNKDEHTDQRKVIEKKNDIETSNIESIKEKNDDQLDILENKKAEDWAKEMRDKYPEVAYQDMQNCVWFKPDPTDWEPSAQELIEIEVNRGKRLQEMLSFDENGKKMLQKLLEAMIEESAPFKNMAMKEKGL